MAAVVTSIFDPLIAKFNASYKQTPENFKEAKQEVLNTIQTAIENARKESTLMQYKAMMKKAEKNQSWNDLISFIYNEEFKRHGFGVLH